MPTSFNLERSDSTSYPPDIPKDHRKPNGEKFQPRKFAKQLFSRGSSPKGKKRDNGSQQDTVNKNNKMSAREEPVFSGQSQSGSPPLKKDEFDSQDHGPQHSTNNQSHALRNSDVSRSSTVETYSASNGWAHNGGGSVLSYETSPTSVGSIPPLQAKQATVDEEDLLEPIDDDDPKNFELVAPYEVESKEYSLEKRTEEILSAEHLKMIFDDPNLLQKFTAFITATRPGSKALLCYYLEALKSIKAIKYANALAEALTPIDGLDFTTNPARPTVNSTLETKVNRAFDKLVRDELPAYVTYTWIQMVSLTIHMRITGTLPPHLRQSSEGLAETFCLTDPSRKDNPIIFASQEFHRTTQYGVSYAIGRNCRFLQGPKTNKPTIDRLSKALREGQEISEIILNYRRDGSTFLNLLVMAPLLDSKGAVRYFIGSQIDVSGLAKEGTDLPALQRLLERQQNNSEHGQDQDETEKSAFLPLTEMLSQDEIELVRKRGGRMHKPQVDEDDDSTSTYRQARLLISDLSPPIGRDSETFGSGIKHSGRMPGIYQNYLLVRPAPSLRILFASPALRIPGMLQSPFLARIGGSPSIRDEIHRAMAAGRSVTAKVRWLSANSKPNDEGRKRWIHCTPLLGQNGAVGVWMVVLVEEHHGRGRDEGRKIKVAPPVDMSCFSPGGKDNDRDRMVYSRTTSYRHNARRGDHPDDDLDEQYGHMKTNSKDSNNTYDRSANNNTSRRPAQTQPIRPQALTPQPQRPDTQGSVHQPIPPNSPASPPPHARSFQTSKSTGRGRFDRVLSNEEFDAELANAPDVPVRVTSLANRRIEQGLPSPDEDEGIYDRGYNSARQGEQGAKSRGALAGLKVAEAVSPYAGSRTNLGEGGSLESFQI